MKIRKGEGGNHAEAYALVVDYYTDPSIKRLIRPVEYQHWRDWCLDNCTGAHAVFYARAGFEREDDAMLFYLAFS